MGILGLVLVRSRYRLYPSPGQRQSSARVFERHGRNPAAHRGEDVKCMTTDPGRGWSVLFLHGVAILDMFARDRPEIGIGEMAQELGLHRSTTSRLAATL